MAIPDFDLGQIPAVSVDRLNKNRVLVLWYY
jgi:hypothetical protein